MSPISANAWYEDDPDEIVTATVDLGNGNGGGGGGGDTDTCTGYSSLDLPTNSLPLSYQTMRAKNPAVADWIDDPATDGMDNNTILNDDTVLENFMWDELNTQRDYVSNPLEFTFDANNCANSTDWAEIGFERLPVERATQNGSNWNVAEMAIEHGVLAADSQRASADLMLDRGLVNGNVRTLKVFDDLWESNDIDSSDITSNSMGDWGALEDNLGSLTRPQGTSGVAKVTALLTLFGDEAKGKYRVKYGVEMWVNDD